MLTKLKQTIILILVMCLPIGCYAKADMLNCDYDISGVTIAKEGSYLIEVSVLVDKKKQANIAIVKQCALLGCLYKGFMVDRIFQRPILTKPVKDKKQEAYINNLVTNDYDNFTSSSYPLQIVKVRKKYKVSAIILVAKDALRQNLERMGIIRKLGL